MRKISIVFSETALELIPLGLQTNGIITDEAKKRHLKPGQMILDSNKHFLPMKGLQNFEKRGRPDIIHFSLLTALESIANKQGMIESVFVHTQNNDLLEISPKTRLPRIYNRFVGIMEQVLFGKSTDLIRIQRNISFENAFEQNALGKSGTAPSIYFFNESGDELLLRKFAKTMQKEIDEKTDSPIIFVFGCFPHGTFSKGIRTYLLSKDATEVKFCGDTLTVWTLVGTAINLYELEAGL
ncbi:MAG: hypothetical protein V1835_07065 [Candidatus Micrarchaeota archaeon]